MEVVVAAAVVAAVVVELLAELGNLELIDHELSFDIQ